MRVDRALVIDAAVLGAALVLFCLNNQVIKEAAAGTPVGDFFKNYFNDVLGGIAFLAYTNIVIGLARPAVRLRRLVPIAVYLFLCGLFWEYAAPLFVAGSVSDPWDVACYVVGGVGYGAVLRVCRMRGAAAS